MVQDSEPNAFAIRTGTNSWCAIGYANAAQPENAEVRSGTQYFAFLSLFTDRTLVTTFMLANTNVQEFFPTPIWTVDLDSKFADTLNLRLLADLDRLTSPRPVLPYLGASWQTDPDMHVRPEFAQLTSVVRKAVKAALDFLQIDYCDFSITGCWANFNPTGGLNSTHTHPNNYLSGVYYVQTPSGADSIDFVDPRPAAVVCMPRTKRLNRFNGNRMTVKVQPGRLVLFPAWLSHSVPINPTDQERISIAFNAMFTEFGETMSATLWKGTLPFRTSRG